ncbi:MAG: DNA-protecting protein DprA [Deferribacteraceae bacterium]|jgi:DNA processing protein|nr:DNA-protecting protein DprA [Deferribacteraceae bacterium]
MINETALQILLANKIGQINFGKIWRYMNGNNLTAEEIFQDNDILKALKIPEESVSSFFSCRESAYKIAERLQRGGVRLLLKGKKDFPEQLKDSYSFLFTYGNLSLLNKRSCGFTGSRKSTKEALRVTAKLAGEMAAVGMTVISGYAEGVDVTAHRAALENSGGTVFVLAEGIFKYKPKISRDLLIDNNFLFVSQFSPVQTWAKYQAMARNNLIIDLSDSMVLIAAGKEGGSYDAAEKTLKKNKKLFVLDFMGKEPAAEANEYFIKKGGLPVKAETAKLKDIIEESKVRYIQPTIEEYIF